MTQSAEDLMYRYRYTDKSLVRQQDKALDTNRTKSLEDTKTLMIEFAKLHVKAQRQAIFKYIKQEGLVTDASIGYLENAYPETLIK